MNRIVFLVLVLLTASAHGSVKSSAAKEGDYLIKVSPQLKASMMQLQNMMPNQTQVEDLGVSNWIRVQVPQAQVKSFNMKALENHPDVIAIQPNYKLGLMHDFRIKDPAQRAELMRKISASEDCPIPLPGFCDDDSGDGGDGGFPFPGDPGNGGGTSGKAKADNPAVPASGSGGSGSDPLLNNQWGMLDIGVQNAWQKTRGVREMIVAVIDTGVDYTHEDLIDNMWRNPGESGRDSNGRDKASNGIDDDNNGYVDDVVGWDFVSNDNLPYDLSVDPIEMMFGGGNPGHGTHCAGNVAARGENGKGISGVAPNVKIMALRFLSEKGQGTTADGIKAIRYAVDNGAQVLSNSWGSEGEDPNDQTGNEALKDAIRYSEQKGSLFIAAAGNGHQGRGYDNDRDAKPAYPASYDMDVIVSVAAIDSNDNLGSFSNWGRRSVDLGAPGVKVFSTMVNGVYSDKVAELFGQTVYWDGTSMATPHVAGAAALYWSLYPNKNWKEVKAALLNSVTKTSTLSNKVSSGGKLDVDALMQH